MAFSNRASLLLALFSFLLVASVHAQNSRIFAWKFAGNSVSQSLPTCQGIPIIIEAFNVSDPLHPGNSTGIPPYYMLAMPVGGTPRRYSLGSDLNSLQFILDYPPSTELLLTVIDSNNTSGGVPGNLFTVVSGQDENCVKPTDSNPGFTISANITDTVTTCDPWGIIVKGGVPPYRWTLAQIKSPVITNVTGLKDQDELVYIMRADVGTKLFVTASDATGQFAHGTPVITPQGSTDVSCIGFNSQTGNSTVFAAQKQAADKAAADAARKKSTIIGVVVTLVVLILLGIAGAFLYIRRRRRVMRPVPFTNYSGKEYGTGHDLTVMPYYSVPRSSGSSEELTPDSMHSRAAVFTTFPANPAARRKAKTAPTTHTPPQPLPESSSRPAAAGPHHSREDDGQMIIQHADASDVMRELPPPYVDRTGGAYLATAAPGKS